MPLFCRADWPRKLRLCPSIWRQKISPTNVNLTDANRLIVKETDNKIKEFVKSDCLASSLNQILRDETTYEGKFIIKIFLKKKELKMNKNYFVKESEKEVNKEDCDVQSSEDSIKSDEKSNEKEATSTCQNNRRTRQLQVTKKQKFVVSLLLCHVVLQFFLPYSHFISKVSNL